MALNSLIRSCGSDIDTTVLVASHEVGEFLADYANIQVVAGLGEHLPSMRLMRSIRATKPDILHLNMNSAWSCQGAHESALVIPSVYITATEHSPRFVGRFKQLRVLRKQLLSKTLSRHIGVGRTMARSIEHQSRLPIGSIMTIYNGVNPLSAPSHHSKLESSLVIGTMARLDNGKRVDLLVEAFLRMRNQSCRLRIIGTGPEESRLKTLAAHSAAANRIEFVNPGIGEEARLLLAGLDLFVLSSRLEGLPLVLVEAAQAGLPAVATNVGSVEEAIIDGLTGRIVSFDIKPQQLANVLDDLLKDTKTLAEMGQRASAFSVKRFCPDTSAGHYLDMWRRVLSGPAKSRLRDRLPIIVPKVHSTPTTLIVGMGRSGTTWLSQALASALEEPIIFEPLNPAHVPVVRALRYHPMPGADGDSTSKETELFRAMLCGQIRNRWTDRLAISGSGGVLKLVRANLALSWIYKEFPNLKVVAVVRHPWAVYQSWQRLGWGKEAWTGLDELACMLDRPSIFQRWPVLSAVLDLLDLQHQEHRFFALWIILNIPLLEQYRLNQLRVWRYEDLTGDPDVFKEFLTYSGAKLSAEEIRSLHISPSAMSRGRQTFTAEVKAPDQAFTGPVVQYRKILKLTGLNEFYEFGNNDETI